MTLPRERALPPVQPLGDAAMAIPIPGVAGSPKTTAAVRAVAEAIEAAGLPGVIDVVPSPDRVTLYGDPSALVGFHAILDSLDDDLEDILHSASRLQSAAPGQTHEIPVHYGGLAGPDLAEVCRISGLDETTCIALHTAPDYLVTAVGFTPGFAYLSGLDPRLAMARRSTPRTRVPAGSVGLGGEQTGVYPSASPGGWQLIGHTATRFFDPTAARPALCAVGDRVRFVAERRSPTDTQPPPDTPPRPIRASNGRPSITVVAPGLMTTVQDMGRPGYRACGVTPGGAADPVAAALANHLVGNPPQAALLELTLSGPTLLFDQSARVALTGGTFPGLAGWRPLQLAAGSTVTLGHASRGCRGYLAIAGGLDIPVVLGSRSTHLAASFGGLAGRPLIAGDQLCIGQSHLPAPEANWGLRHDLVPVPDGAARLRLLVPEGEPTTVDGLLGTPFRVSSRSNRMGLRLEGSPLTSAQPSDGISRGVVAGTVQLPPDGQPILLLTDCQTIGGYPVIGHVASADLRLAAQLRPGDTLTFEPTTRQDAIASWQRQHALLTATAAEIATRWPLRLVSPPHTPSSTARHEPPCLHPEPHLSIDLNCDVGEAAGHDDVLIPLVSSVNIACGGHAGDAATMEAAVGLARAHGVAIGAHPGHRDREHFGRRQLAITPAQAALLVCKQVEALATIIGHPPAHVKLHGGLYHQVAYGRDLADAVCTALAATWPGIRIVLPAGSLAIDIAASHSLPVVREGFLDRGYQDNGRLADRSTPGSVLTNPDEVGRRAVRFVRERLVTTQSGRDLALTAETLCLHGDGPAAVPLLGSVRRALAAAGVRIGPHALAFSGGEASAEGDRPEQGCVS